MFCPVCECELDYIDKSGEDNLCPRCQTIILNKRSCSSEYFRESEGIVRCSNPKCNAWIPAKGSNTSGYYGERYCDECFNNLALELVQKQF